MKTLSVWMVIAGLMLGLWQWQVNNIYAEEAQQAQQVARAQHPQWGANSIALVSSYTPAPVEDRALGMAFAFLLCGVGCFMYKVSPTEKPEQKPSGAPEAQVTYPAPGTIPE